MLAIIDRTFSVPDLGRDRPFGLQRWPTMAPEVDVLIRGTYM